MVLNFNSLVLKKGEEPMTQKILSSNYMFKGKRMAVRVDNSLFFNGRESIPEIVKRSDISCIEGLTKDGGIAFCKTIIYMEF